MSYNYRIGQYVRTLDKDDYLDRFSEARRKHGNIMQIAQVYPARYAATVSFVDGSIYFIKLSHIKPIIIKQPEYLKNI